METKVKKQVELWKIVLFCILLVSIFVGIYLLIMNIMDNSNNVTSDNIKLEERISSYFPNPDRLVIKKQGESSYYVITNKDKEYIKLLDILDKEIKKSGNQIEEYTKEQLDNIEKDGYFLMLDYNKVSKNYILSFTDKKMIRYKEVGGTVVRQNMKTEELEKSIEKIYDTNKLYKVHSEEIYSNRRIDNIPEDCKDKLKEVRDGIYQGKITDNNQLKEYKDALDMEFVYAEDVEQKDLFKDYDVIITVSKYHIKDVYGTIRNVNYTYSSDRESNYQVHLYFASKAINSNCIYNKVEQPKIDDSNYQANQYLANYRIYSDYPISDETARNLGFSKQQGGMYTVFIQSRAQLNNINQVLKLYGFSLDGVGKYQNIYIPNDNYQYILCIKNTNGHFEADLKGREDYVNGMNFDDNTVNITTYEKKDSESKMKLQGNLLALPKNITYTKINISEISYPDTIFINNKRLLSASEAKKAAKSMLGGSTDTQAFLDILNSITPLAPYSVVHADKFKRVWVVTTEEKGMPTAIVVDATTGEVIGMNEMGC